MVEKERRGEDQGGGGEAVRSRERRDGLTHQPPFTVERWCVIVARRRSDDLMHTRARARPYVYVHRRE